MKKSMCGTRLGSGAIGLFAALFMTSGQAGEIDEATGLADYMAGKGDAQLLSDFGIKWGGWIHASISHNFNSSPDKFNGPVTFGDRTDELQLNQLYLYLQKAAATSGDEWDWGARFDVTYGTDSIFTQAYGTTAFDPRTGAVITDRGHWDLHLTSFNERFYALAFLCCRSKVNMSG